MDKSVKSKSLEPPTIEDVIYWQQRIGDKGAQAARRVWDEKYNWSKWISGKTAMHAGIRELYIRKARIVEKKRNEKRSEATSKAKPVKKGRP